MSIQIFHVGSDLPLADFAAAVFDALEIEDAEERDSDNYPGGVYYRGQLGDITLRICEESDVGWEDYQHWVVLDADLEPDDSRQLSEGLIERLLSRGFGVAIEASQTTQSITREIYAQAADGIASTQEVRPIPAS